MIDLRVGLAPGWDAAIDPGSGAPYYFNTATGTSQYERPGGVMQGVVVGVSIPVAEVVFASDVVLAEVVPEPAAKV